MTKRERIVELIHECREHGRDVMLEPHAFRLLQHLGFRVPLFMHLSKPQQIDDQVLTRFSGDKVVLKIVSRQLAHKSDVAGVAVLAKEPNAVQAHAESMLESLAAWRPEGLMLQEYVPYEPSLGNELLLGMRWNREFGPVVSCAAGGLDTEDLRRGLTEQSGLTMWSPKLGGVDSVEADLGRLLAVDLMIRSRRGRSPRVPQKELRNTVDRFSRAAEWLVGEFVDELEINPLVAHQGSLVALDVLVTVSKEHRTGYPARPLRKIDRLLHPRSVAIVGVSRRLNPGHQILRNLLREGFEARRILLIKQGLESFAGCACYPDVASLPEAVDLLIVSVAARDVPEIVRQVIELRKAESLIVIPGGLGEKEGSEELVSKLRSELGASRSSRSQGPVLNGGNCLGIRSRPGKLDTFFLPPHKLPPSVAAARGAALISQSGAFLAAKSSKLSRLPVKYSVSVGNQLDLTVGDYLTFLESDQDITLFAVYLEGFQPLDGARALQAAHRIAQSGRPVIFYRAGRSEAGARAAASHTAALAGGYQVFRALARLAGVLVAETLVDFEDLVSTFHALSGRPVNGRRVGAVSNAGFECVAMWDTLGELVPAEFSPATSRRLGELLRRSRIDGVVDLRNPLDLTPIVGDADFEEAARSVLQDEAVDLGIVGCVPLTGALNTMPPAEGHSEDVFASESVANRLVGLWGETAKPWVAVVDAGEAFDGMAELLRRGGVPVFRSADRALLQLRRFCEFGLRWPGRAPS
jgi:acyl-CoA synthetase (NDP forming)